MILSETRCGSINGLGVKQLYMTDKTKYTAMAEKAEIARLKKKLQLEPHPSGYGAFKEMWKADRQVTFTSQTSHGGQRSSGSSIYFLLEAPNCVTWHKHLSDEGFYWHAGGNVQMHMILNDGTHTCHVLGDVVKHEKCVAQVVIPHDTWYAAELASGASYSLYSAVVMPVLNLKQTIDDQIAAAGIPDAKLRSFADQMAAFLVDSRSENTNYKSTFNILLNGKHSRRALAVQIFQHHRSRVVALATVNRQELFVYIYIYTVRLAGETTCIKRPLVLRDHIFSSRLCCL